MSIQVLEDVFERFAMVQQLVEGVCPGVLVVPQTANLHDAPGHYQNFTRCWLGETAHRLDLDIESYEPLGGLWSSTASRLVLQYAPCSGSPAIIIPRPDAVHCSGCCSRWECSSLSRWCRCRSPWRCGPPGGGEQPHDRAQEALTQDRPPEERRMRMQVAAVHRDPVKVTSKSATVPSATRPEPTSSAMATVRPRCCALGRC